MSPFILAISFLGRSWSSSFDRAWSCAKRTVARETRIRRRHQRNHPRSSRGERLASAQPKNSSSSRSRPQKENRQRWGTVTYGNSAQGWVGCCTGGLVVSDSGSAVGFDKLLLHGQRRSRSALPFKGPRLKLTRVCLRPRLPDALRHTRTAGRSQRRRPQL